MQNIKKHDERQTKLSKIIFSALQTGICAGKKYLKTGNKNFVALKQKPNSLKSYEIFYAILISQVFLPRTITQGAVLQ